MAVTIYTPSGITNRDSTSISGVAWDVAASCSSTVGDTAQLLTEGLAFGSVRVPNGSSITSITWYGVQGSSSTPVPAKDEDGVALTQTVAADEIHAVPSALAGMRYILPKTDASGTLHFHFER